MRKSDDVRVGGFFAAFVEDDRDQLAALDAQTAERRTKYYFPALLFNRCAAAIVEVPEGNGRDTHTVASLVRENCFPENVDAIAGVNAIQFLRKCANKNHSPEARDGC